MFLGASLVEGVELNSDLRHSPNHSASQLFEPHFIELLFTRVQEIRRKLDCGFGSNLCADLAIISKLCSSKGSYLGYDIAATV